MINFDLLKTDVEMMKEKVERRVTFRDWIVVITIISSSFRIEFRYRCVECGKMHKFFYSPVEHSEILYVVILEGTNKEVHSELI